MIRQSINNDFDLESLAIKTIQLEPEHFNKAKEISDRVTGEAHKWQTYINALALFGFEQWLEEYESDLLINRDNCSIFHPSYANMLETVCNLRVGELKCCLIAIDDFSNDEIEIPRTAIDLPEFVAHFYVVIEVSEEEQEAIIRGFIRYDQLLKYFQLANLETQTNWYKKIPASLLESQLDHLLLYFNILKSSAITLPAIPVKQIATLSKSELDTVLTKLQSPEQKIWDVMSEEQGSRLLSCPQCLDLLYQWQTTPKLSASLSTCIKDKLTLLTQPVINTGLWLQKQMDEIAQSLSWIMLPEVIPLATPFRKSDDPPIYGFKVAPKGSFTEKFQKILFQRQLEGTIQISPDASASCTEINHAGLSLQMCAVVWTDESKNEWTLFLMLKASPDSKLPKVIRLQISDLEAVLADVFIEQGDDYLSGYAIGTQQEKFLAKVILSNGETLTLPPFACEIEEY